MQKWMPWLIIVETQFEPMTMQTEGSDKVCLEMWLEAMIVLTCRMWWREFGDAHGRHHCVNLESMKKRVWRCSWRLSWSTPGDWVWASLEMRFESEIMPTTSPYSCKFGYSLWGRIHVNSEMQLMATSKQNCRRTWRCSLWRWLIWWRWIGRCNSCQHSFQWLVNLQLWEWQKLTIPLSPHRGWAGGNWSAEIHARSWSYFQRSTHNYEIAGSVAVRQLFMGGCCTWCVLYSAYAVLSVSWIHCIL